MLVDGGPLWMSLYIQTYKLHSNSIFGTCQTKCYSSFNLYLFGVEVGRENRNVKKWIQIWNWVLHVQVICMYNREQERVRGGQCACAWDGVCKWN
jgi:hypothetical protein